MGSPEREVAQEGAQVNNQCYERGDRTKNEEC
jgi:hypothetical protein